MHRRRVTRKYTFDRYATGPTSTLEFDARQDPSHLEFGQYFGVRAGTQRRPPRRLPRSRPDTGVVGDGITDPAILTLTGTAVANSTVKVLRRHDAARYGDGQCAAGPGAFTTAPLPDGVHSFTATIRCPALPVPLQRSMNVTVDTVAPAAPTIASFSTDSGTVGDHITNDSTLTLTGTAEANSTVKVFDGTTLLGSAVANGSGAWTYTTAALANGAHSLTATASDAAGNTGAASAALSVTIDTTAPVAPSITSFSPDTGTVGDKITSANVLTLTGTAEANTTVKVFDGATLAGQRGGQWQRRLDLYDGGAGERCAQPDGDGDRCGRQYRCGVGGPGGHDYGAAGSTDHHLVLA